MPESDEPVALTDKQRDKIRAYFTDNPDGGNKNALKAAGFTRVTAAQAKQIIEADDELVLHRQQALKIDEHSLLKQIGRIAHDDDHKDQLKAAQFALTAVHKYRTQDSKVDVQHGGDVNLIIESAFPE